MDKKSASEILRSLVNGRDPQTGETISRAEVLSRTAIRDAIRLALDALEAESAPRQPSLTGRPHDRAGEPWGPDEEHRLLAGFDAGRTVAELSAQHSRTKGAIRSRLAKCGRLLPEEQETPVVAHTARSSADPGTRDLAGSGWIVPELTAIAMGAAQCRDCFAGGHLPEATIKIAEPRWVGRTYWQSEPRILFMMINPGAGGGEADRRYDSLLRDFRAGRTDLRSVFLQQERDLPSWGWPTGKFKQFYLDAPRLALNDIAFANLAWCATGDNSSPESMLVHCFDTHTSALLRLLAPNLVFLSGRKVAPFAPVIQRCLPAARIEPILHYAHRLGAEATDREGERIREIVAQVRRR